MTIAPLPSDIKVTGVNQDSLVTFLQNVVDVINELVDDHATNKTLMDATKTAVNAVITAAATNIAAVAAVTAVSASSAATLTNATDLTLLKG